MKRYSTAIMLGMMLTFTGIQTAWSANWLMLQGTENPKMKKNHRVFAFIQPSYTRDFSHNLQGLTGGFAANNGERIANTGIAPNFDSDKEMHIRRARIGMRGRFTGPLRNSFTSKMNYFFLTEVAPNGLTYDFFGDRARFIALDHLSVTFNHIKGARIRAGLFKTPGPEETFAAIALQNYIEFTDFAAREMLERFVDGAQRPARSGTSPALGNNPESEAYGFNAVRDWGLQVFDSFKKGKWDLSYAVMVGRGEGIHKSSDSDDNKELYLYGSAEYALPGGRGPRKNGVKMYGWHQSGKREFKSDPLKTEYDRRRYGVGVMAVGKLFGGKYKHRIGADLMYGEGMLFLSPAGGVAQHGRTTAATGGGPLSSNLQYAADDKNKSRGVTLDYGFYLNKKWQFDYRYSRHNLLYKSANNVNDGNERIFTHNTYGITYHFTPKVRLTMNYTDKKVEAPKIYGTVGADAVVTSNVQNIVDTIDDRLAFQLTWIF